MSTKQNDAWIDAAYESFQEAISTNNLDLAKAIVADTRDAGFVIAASQMESVLQNVPITKITE